MNPCQLPAAIEVVDTPSYDDVGYSVKSVSQAIGTQWLKNLRNNYATRHSSGRMGKAEEGGETD